MDCLMRARSCSCCAITQFISWRMLCMSTAPLDSPVPPELFMASKFSLSLRMAVSMRASKAACRANRAWSCTPVICTERLPPSCPCEVRAWVGESIDEIGDAGPWLIPKRAGFKRGLCRCALCGCSAWWEGQVFWMPKVRPPWCFSEAAQAAESQPMESSSMQFPFRFMKRRTSHRDSTSAMACAPAPPMRLFCKLTSRSCGHSGSTFARPSASASDQLRPE
mmetsp:Transcript_170549/g.547032  ORF Transcript_170549/g.547032 Transcript_170549/m.547032 type:complete len:222 (+) Transcript_170549:731-1396(+)